MSASQRAEQSAPIQYKIDNVSSTVQNYMMPEDLMAGLRTDGRMSVVRRFFCLFVTFDVLFTSLMWLISLALVGNFNFYEVFETQILHYGIRTSFFDVVMAAIVRFISLLLFYALLRIEHWIIVAITTAGTCAFLVAKVYMFNWSISSQPVMQVLLILTSFIISWAEAWFLDLRVIPQERQASEYVNVTVRNERSPLLHNFLQGNSRFDTFSESIGTFYSPVETPEDSGDESEGIQRNKKPQPLTQEMIFEYHRKGEEVLETAWGILNNGNWSLEKETPDGDKLFSQKLSGERTLFHFIGTIDISPKNLFYILCKKIDVVPIWNPTIKESKVIQVVDDTTDICYQLTAEAGGGIIRSREFVLLRHWQRNYDSVIIANASIDHPTCPQNSKYIRGENGPGCWAIKRIPGEEEKSELLWLLNTDIKGWVLQYAVNSSLTGVMVEYVSFLRKYVCQFKQNML